MLIRAHEEAAQSRPPRVRASAHRLEVVLRHVPGDVPAEHLRLRVSGAECRPAQMRASMISSRASHVQRLEGAVAGIRSVDPSRRVLRQNLDRDRLRRRVALVSQQVHVAAARVDEALARPVALSNASKRSGVSSLERRIIRLPSVIRSVTVPLGNSAIYACIFPVRNATEPRARKPRIFDIFCSILR